MSKSSLFDQMGGEPALRAVIDRFIDRVFDDMMIGFFFRNASRERVKAKEYEFAARHLGADLPYTGKSIRDAHAPHPIMGGQFNRRLQILRETLEEMGVPEPVRAHWLKHTEALRSQVTRDASNACDPSITALPKGAPGAGS
ncbi:MAG TPA: group 1 truncated hemoglobin [Polyangiaceae bacterium]